MLWSTGSQIEKIIITQFTVYCRIIMQIHIERMESSNTNVGKYNIPNYLLQNNIQIT